MGKTELARGDIVQLHPTDCRNPMLAGCLMVVTDPKEWGAQGYVQSPGKGGKGGGQAYYRATWEEMCATGGSVEWMAG